MVFRRRKGKGKSNGCGKRKLKRSGGVFPKEDLHRILTEDSSAVEREVERNYPSPLDEDSPSASDDVAIDHRESGRRPVRKCRLSIVSGPSNPAVHANLIDSNDESVERNSDECKLSVEGYENVNASQCLIVGSTPLLGSSEKNSLLVTHSNKIRECGKSNPNSSKTSQVVTPDVNDDVGGKSSIGDESGAFVEMSEKSCKLEDRKEDSDLKGISSVSLSCHASVSSGKRDSRIQRELRVLITRTELPFNSSDRVLRVRGSGKLSKNTDDAGGSTRSVSAKPSAKKRGKRVSSVKSESSVENMDSQESVENDDVESNDYETKGRLSGKEKNSKEILNSQKMTASSKGKARKSLVKQSRRLSDTSDEANIFLTSITTTMKRTRRIKSSTPEVSSSELSSADVIDTGIVTFSDETDSPVPIAAGKSVLPTDDCHLVATEGSSSLDSDILSVDEEYVRGAVGGRRKSVCTPAKRRKALSRVVRLGSDTSDETLPQNEGFTKTVDTEKAQAITNRSVVGAEREKQKASPVRLKSKATLWRNCRVKSSSPEVSSSEFMLVNLMHSGTSTSSIAGIHASISGVDSLSQCDTSNVVGTSGMSIRSGPSSDNEECENLGIIPGNRLRYRIKSDSDSDKIVNFSSNAVVSSEMRTRKGRLASANLRNDEPCSSVSTTSADAVLSQDLYQEKCLRNNNDINCADGLQNLLKIREKGVSIASKSTQTSFGTTGNDVLVKEKSSQVSVGVQENIVMTNRETQTEPVAEMLSAEALGNSGLFGGENLPKLMMLMLSQLKRANEPCVGSTSLAPQVLLDDSESCLKNNIPKSHPSQPSDGHNLSSKFILKRKTKSPLLEIESGSESRDKLPGSERERSSPETSGSTLSSFLQGLDLVRKGSLNKVNKQKHGTKTSGLVPEIVECNSAQSDFQHGETDSGDISLKKPPQKTISLSKIRSSNTVDRTQDHRRLKCSVTNSDRVREDINAVSVSDVCVLEEHGKNDSAVGVGSGKDSSFPSVPFKVSGKEDACVRIDSSYKCLENGVSDMSSDGDVSVVWSTKSGKAPKKIQRSRMNKVFDSCSNDNMIEVIKEVKSPVNQPVPEDVGVNTPELYSSLVEKENEIARTNNPKCDPSKTSEGHTLRTKRFLKIKKEPSSLVVEDGSGSKSCPIDNSIEVIKVVKSPHSTPIPEGDGEVTPELKSVLVEKGSETVKTNISKSDPSKPSGGHDLRGKRLLKRKKESSSLVVEDGSGSKSSPIDSSVEVIKVLKSPDSTPIPEGDGEVTPEPKSVLVEKGSETVKTNISKSDPSKSSGGHDLRGKRFLKRKKESSSLVVEDGSGSKSSPIDSSIEVIKVVRSPDSLPIPEGDCKVIGELKSGQVAKESEKVRTNIPKSDSCKQAGGHNLRTKLFPNRKIDSSSLAVGDESEGKIDRSIEVIKVLKSPVSQPIPKADDWKIPGPNLDPVEKDNELPLPRKCCNISDVITVQEKRRRRSVGKDKFMVNSGPTPLKKVRKGPESITLSLPKSICDVKEVGPSALNDDINEALKREEDDQDSVGDDADSDVISIYGESDYDQLLSGMGSQCPEVTFDTIEEENSSSFTPQDAIPVSRISSDVPSPISDKVAENEPEIPESSQHGSLLDDDIPSKTSDPTLDDSAPAGDVRLSPHKVTAAEEVHPINDTGSLPGEQASRMDQGGTPYPADTGSLPAEQASRMDQGGTLYPAEDVQSIVSGGFIDANTSDGANSCDLRIVAYHDVNASTPSHVPASQKTYKFKPPAAIRKITAKADTVLRNGNTIFKGMCFAYLRKGKCKCGRFKHEFRPHVLQSLEKMDSWDIYVSLQYSLRREFVHFWDEFGVGILNLLACRREGKYLYGVLFVYCCTKLNNKRWLEVLKCVETHDTSDEHCVVQILRYFIINHLHKQKNFSQETNRSTYDELVDKVTSISCNFRSTSFLHEVLEVLVRQEFWFSKRTFEQLLQRCVDEASTDVGLELCFLFAKFIIRLGSLSDAEPSVISLLQELIKILEKNNDDLSASNIRAQILDDNVPKSIIEGGSYSMEGPSESVSYVTSMEEQSSGVLETVQKKMEWPNSNYPGNQPPIMPLLPNLIPKSVNPYCGVAEFSVAEVSTSFLSHTQSVYKPNSGAMPLQRRDVLCDNFGMSSNSIPSSSISAGVNRMGRSDSFGQMASNPSVLPPVNSLGHSCGEMDTKGQVKNFPSSLDDEKDQGGIFSEEEDKDSDHYEEIQSYPVQESEKLPTERSSQPLTYSEVFKQKYKIPLLPTPDSLLSCPSSSLTLEEVIKKRKWTPVLMFKFFNPCLGSAEKEKDFVFQVVNLLEKDMTAAFPVVVAMVNCLASKEFMETSNCNKRMWIKKVVNTMVLNVMLKMILCDMWSEGYKLMNLANDASLPLLEAETYLLVMSTTGKILFLSEICFRCEQMKEALHLLRMGNLFCQIPSQWKYDSCDSDFETRVTILTSLICKMALGGYSDLAPTTYLEIYRSQKGVSESVDLLVHANKVIVCAINAGYYNLAYEVYETVPDDEPVLPFLTLRALLCGMVSEDIKGLAKPIFKKMCEYGIYPLMKENELVTEIVIKSFWLKEEIFMVLSSVLQIWGPILLVHQPTKHKEPGFCVSLLLKKFPDLDNQEAVLKLDEESEKDPVPYYLMLPSNSVEHVLGEVLYVLENMLVPPIKHTVFTVDDGAAKRVVFNRMSLINHLINAEVKSEVDG
ncbi:uncharacterized protein LOC124155852 [Ischnura elegans]|uniref:uncharacterized protein LOC124155852 n=1 Tax=Ischnura elegans TaxID=197161 RepID=UPI001ED89C73|nr:uncharacterized protein LOC124155852 [Ischnura elegans]XP_046385959.1 uncharacterized protein LOC124155852 [Ischnura elegans]